MTARKANGTDTHRRATAIVDGCITIQNIYNAARHDFKRGEMTAAELLRILHAVDGVSRRMEQHAHAIVANSGYAKKS